MGLAEVEARVGTERHEVYAGLDVAGADCDCDLSAGGVGADDVGHAGDFEDAVEVVALDPVLEFAGAVAGVCADFKVSDYHHFGAKDWRAGLASRGETGADGEENTGEDRCLRGMASVSHRIGLWAPAMHPMEDSLEMKRGTWT